MNSIVSQVSEIAAYAFSGFIFNMMGLKYTLYISYVLSISGMLALTITSGVS